MPSPVRSKRMTVQWVESAEDGALTRDHTRSQLKATWHASRWQYGTIPTPERKQWQIPKHSQTKHMSWRWLSQEKCATKYCTAPMISYAPQSRPKESRNAPPRGWRAGEECICWRSKPSDFNNTPPDKNGQEIGFPTTLCAKETNEAQECYKPRLTSDKVHCSTHQGN